MPLEIRHRWRGALSYNNKKRQTCHPHPPPLVQGRPTDPRPSVITFRTREGVKIRSKFTLVLIPESDQDFNWVLISKSDHFFTWVLIPRIRWKASEAYRNRLRSSVVWAEIMSWACSTSMRYAPSCVTWWWCGSEQEGEEDQDHGGKERGGERKERRGGGEGISHSSVAGDRRWRLEHDFRGSISVILPGEKKRNR